MTASRIPGFDFPGGQPRVQSGPSDATSMHAIDHPVSYGLGLIAGGLLFSAVEVLGGTGGLWVALDFIGNFGLNFRELLGLTVASVFIGTFVATAAKN